MYYAMLRAAHVNERCAEMLKFNEGIAENTKQLNSARHSRAGCCRDVEGFNVSSVYIDANPPWCHAMHARPEIVSRKT